MENKRKILDEKYNDCYQLALDMHNIRNNKAIALEESVLNETQDLMLNNVNFKVNIDECNLSNSGIDDIEFFVSLNKGEKLKPLKDVASGGEISRLMLALKTIFTSLSNCSLAIFDEIDTGVSGKVGLAMGKKMKEISKNTQVLTITHLASVAACADNHYFIYKEDNLLSSNTRIKQLNRNEIIQELASISSTDTTENAIAAAEELYKLGISKYTVPAEAEGKTIKSLNRELKKEVIVYLYKIIYTFHVPALMFITGKFAKFDKKRILKHLCFPYIVFQ